ncbi:MAG TPA: AsmA family protein [Hyphomicrobiaceae bacterium]|nr:AsmA family protein [Hyphomicrobiaceae bacterium]
MSNFFVALAVFLITVVGALFTVPHFIDWNGYRGVFEEEGSRLLGREVRVGGAVNLHLLPTPYFRFEKVRIADTSVNLEEPFFRTESVTVKLSVPPLLRGAIEANEIEFQRPVLRLALNDKGGWNWQTFGQMLSNAPYLPTNVALTSLRIKDGVLAVHGINGAERARLEGLDGELSSPSLDGPYRFRGTYGPGGAEREIRLSTAKAEDDGTVRFKLALRLGDVGSVYNLDGRLLDLMGKSRLDGELTARLPVASIWQPAPARAGSSSYAKGATAETKAQTSDVAFDLKANLVADTSGGSLSDVALSFEQDGQPQLLSGVVRAVWREALAVDMDLASRWLDLDRIAGTAENSSPLDSIVPLAMRLRDLLPADGRSRASFTVDQANIGRDAVSGLRLALVRSRDRLEVEELRLGMPGGSRGELQGTMSGPAGAPVFDGSFGVRGGSIARFLGWARGSPLPADAKGDGAFGARAKVSIATGRVDVRDIVGDLSGTALNGAAHYRWDGRPEMALTIEGPQIDVRPFVPAGASLFDMFNLLAQAEATAGGGQAQSKQLDTSIRVSAGQLITSGRTYRDVGLELDLKGGNLRLPMLRVSGDEGYSLELEGEVNDVGGRPKGSIRAVAASEAQQGVLPLAELLGLPNAFRPSERRVQGLAPLRIGGSMAFGGRTPTSADLQIDGEANGAGVKASARLDGNAAGWRKGFADVAGVIEGPEAGRLVSALLGSGATSSSNSARPGRILVKAGGLPADGLTTIASIDAMDLALDFRGQVQLRDAGNKVAGDLEIKGADAARVAAIAGLAPPLRLDAAPASGAMRITATEGSLDIERLAMTIGGSEVRGKLAIAPAGERRRIAADLTVAELSVARLLGPMLDQRLAITGAVESLLAGQQSPWPEEPFDTAVLEGFEGTIKLETPRVGLTPALGLSRASLDIELAPGKIDVKQLAGDLPGGRLQAKLVLDRRPGNIELTGSATVEATLEALAPPRSGAAPRGVGPLKGTIEYSARGASPRALMASLQGKGVVEIGEAKLENLWPGALGAAIEAALKVEADKVGPTLRQRLLDGMSEGQLALGPNTLAIEVVDGQLRSKSIVAETDEGRATGVVNLDVRTFALDSEWLVERKRLKDRIDEKAALPAAIIQYRGPVTALSALDPRINTDALERELTARKMELDLEDLERLRQADEARRRSELERQRQQPPQDPWLPTRPAAPNTPVLPKGTSPATPG